MKTGAGWLCLFLLTLALVPSFAYGGSSSWLELRAMGASLAATEIVDVRSLAELLGGGPTMEAPATVSVQMLAPPPVVPRSEWGADESIRFLRARQRVAPSFSPVRKLIIHHTATRGSEPPLRAIRRIYRSHTLSRGFADIGYHYLISSDGRVFKGRYSGPAGTRRQDRRWADRQTRFAVRGAHALAANRGTVGIALLGNYEKRPLPRKARATLVRLLAWLSDRYGIDPLGSSWYPTSRRMVRTRNIAGHRAYGRTVCPGEAVERELPEIRRDVARRLRTAARARPQVRAPLISGVQTARIGWHGASIKWTTDEPSRTVVAVRAEGSADARTTARLGFTREHAVRVGRLRRGTAYVFRIGGADDDGNIAWSAPHSLRTKG